MSNMDIDKITRMCGELKRWCEEQNLPLMSADELILENDINQDQTLWLQDFIDRWCEAIEGGLIND